MTINKNTLYIGIFLIILIMLSGLAIVAFAQEAGNEVVNWCDPGQPWEGRCDHSDPDVQHFLWRAGWCQAALEAGVVEGDMNVCMGIVVEEEDEDESSGSKSASESSSSDKVKRVVDEEEECVEDPEASIWCIE